LPINCREGRATALLFENIPGGDLEILTDMRYEDGPDAFNRTVLEKLEHHYPSAFERVDHDSFGLMGPTDILQGGLTPVVREDYVQLSNARSSRTTASTSSSASRSREIARRSSTGSPTGPI
jgi:hypothetical protein